MKEIGNVAYSTHTELVNCGQRRMIAKRPVALQQNINMFTLDELQKAMKNTKGRKVSGFNGIPHET